MVPERGRVGELTGNGPPQAICGLGGVVFQGDKGYQANISSVLLQVLSPQILAEVTDYSKTSYCLGKVHRLLQSAQA